jgi:hypothetical protein
MMRRTAALAGIGLLASGCAYQQMLEQPFHSMRDDELLTHYYRLQHASGDSDRGVAMMQSQYATDRIYGGPNLALGNVVVQGIMASQGAAVRERAIHVRVELERRGWTPAKGLPPRTMHLAQPIEQAQATMAGEQPKSAAAAASARYLAYANEWVYQRGCNVPVLINADPTFETYRVRCGAQRPVTLRCDDGGCRVTG